MDWAAILKVVGPIFGAFCVGTVMPAARRAIRNRGKTEQEIAQEELDRAFKRAEAAHANSDPTDDAAADAAVEAARVSYNKIRRARAVWDGITEDTPAKGPPP